jgi:hypothetical protein
MIKSKSGLFIKLFVVFVVSASFILSARIIYKNLLRALKINPELVELYRPRIDKNLVRQAADALRKKSAN